MKAKELGATVVNYTSDDWPKEVKRLTNRKVEWCLSIRRSDLPAQLLR